MSEVLRARMNPREDRTMSDPKVIAVIVAGWRKYAIAANAGNEKQKIVGEVLTGCADEIAAAIQECNEAQAAFEAALAHKESK